MRTGVEPSGEPGAPLHDLATWRRVLALLVALASDAASVWIELVPPVQWTLDVATALVLFALLSFRWWLLPVLVIEAIPGLGTFPTWTLAVAALVAARGARAR